MCIVPGKDYGLNPNRFPIPGLYLPPASVKKDSTNFLWRINNFDTFSHGLRNLRTSPNSIQKSPTFENLVATSENLIKRICDNNFFLLLSLIQTCIGSGCVSLFARVRIKMRVTFQTKLKWEKREISQFTQENFSTPSFFLLNFSQKFSVFRFWSENRRTFHSHSR